jgi:hypothetical protein
MDSMFAARNISARAAHVEHEHDLLVWTVRPGGRLNSYLSTVLVPADHPDVQRDRVMGPIFQDAGQQLVRAISHLFEGVPADHGIAIHETNVLLRAPAFADAPIEARVHLEIDRDNPRHFLWQCESSIEFRQQGIRVAEAHYRFMTLPRTVGDPMMRRHHARPSVIAA